MLQGQRQAKILRYLADHEYLSVVQAVDVFGASPATIRRDFDALADSGQVERIHGGIRHKSASAPETLPFAAREEQQFAEKDALAQAAVQLLSPGDVVFVDGGTTTVRFAYCMPDMDLRLITNSVRMATLLEERMEQHSKLEIFLTGGFLYAKCGVLLGPNTEANLSQYNADWAFLSVGGVSEAGVTNTNELVVRSEQAMVANAEKTVVIADHTKIGRKAMCPVCSLDEIDCLVTDAWPESEELLGAFEARGIEVIRVQIDRLADSSQG